MVPSPGLDEAVACLDYMFHLQIGSSRQDGWSSGWREAKPGSVHEVQKRGKASGFWPAGQRENIHSNSCSASEN